MAEAPEPCLSKQVGGNIPGVGAIIGDDNDLAGTIKSIDTDHAVDEFFSLDNVPITGSPIDLVHAGDGRRAVSQGGDSLGAANRKNAVDTGDFGGPPALPAKRSLTFPGGHQDDFFYAGDPRRDGRH